MSDAWHTCKYKGPDATSVRRYCAGCGQADPKDGSETPDVEDLTTEETAELRAWAGTHWDAQCGCTTAPCEMVDVAGLAMRLVNVHAQCPEPQAPEESVGGPCGHGRSDWRMCPHCNGVNDSHGLLGGWGVLEVTMRGIAEAAGYEGPEDLGLLCAHIAKLRARPEPVPPCSHDFHGAPGGRCPLCPRPGDLKAIICFEEKS